MVMGWTAALSRRAYEPRRTNLTVLTSPGRNSSIRRTRTIPLVHVQLAGVAGMSTIDPAPHLNPHSWIRRCYFLAVAAWIMTA